MSKLNLNLYKKLYLIRRTEKTIIENYNDDEMRTPMHISMGEEAIAAGICQALRAKDQIFGTYRSRAFYLAKTGETDKFFAEIYGKATGGAKGKAGAMHMAAPELGFMEASAIVGSIIPVAVGAAFANKRNKNGKMVVVYFGDGAIDEGCFWESLNVACLMKLPILFVCEDNKIAAYTPTFKRHGYKSITDIVSKFNCNVFQKETTDAELIYKLSCKAIKSIKTTQRPSFLYLKYYRYLEHVGINEDFDQSGRSREEFEKWYKKDPVNLQRKKLLKSGIKEKKVVALEEEIDNQVKNSLKLAQKAPFAKISEVYKDVFSEKT